MDAQSLTETTERSAEAESPRWSTIPEFCARKCISVPFYYVLRKRGLGPREVHLGRAVRITPEAEAEWDRERGAVVA